MLSDTPVYPISVAARILNISVHTVRMYEKEGLIVPFKKSSGHRLYSDLDIERLSCIRRAINQSKISIAAIKTIYTMIPCWQINQCSDEARKNCIVFNSNVQNQPCWTIKNKDDRGECRKCKVYNNFADCQTIRVAIIDITKGNS